MADLLISLHLKNFGPWEDQLFEFDPQVNVFIGESDTGKSAILNGLKFILYDKLPKSADGNLGFITRPLETGKICEVTLKLSLNKTIHTIIRRKGKSINEYQLNNETPQKANNKTIPEKIKNILNFKPVNFHAQSDPPFLLSDKPSDVAKQLADVIDIEEIDQYVSHAFSFIREKNKEFKARQLNIETLQEELNQLDFVKEFQEKVNKFSLLDNHFNSLYKKFNKIEIIVNSIDLLEIEKIKNVKLLGLKNLINDIATIDIQYIDTLSKFNFIKDRIELIEALKSQNERYKMLVGIEDHILSFNSKVIYYDNLFDEYSKVINIVKRINELETDNKNTSEELEKNKKQLSGLICPTCGKKYEI